MTPAQARVVGLRAWLSLFSSTNVGAQDGVLLVAADPLMQLSRRPYSRGEGAGIERHKHRIQGQAAGRPLRWWAAAIARCRTA